jgi:hypothetical protein
MKIPHFAWGAVLLPACGGAESVAADATTDAVVDSDADTNACGDGCERTEAAFDVPCDCPPGWVCVTKPAVAQLLVYCARIADCCGGVPTCECMGNCACAPKFGRGCVSASAARIDCDGPISIRAAKTEVRYIDEVERASLARQTLSMPLATYRYRAEDPSHPRRLGFIIDDQPRDTFAVAADRTHVDLYGYASMLLATIQQQQRTIDELRDRVARLEAGVTPQRPRDRRSRSPRRRASRGRASPR